METASDSAFYDHFLKKKHKEEDFKLKNLRCSFFVFFLFVARFLFFFVCCSFFVVFFLFALGSCFTF